jgi:hypothetical protein
LTAVLLQTTGCLSVPVATETSSIPNWVQTPPSDSNIYIYGIGEGFSLDDAKKNGLRDIAGKLATNISSNSESKSSDHDGNSSQYFRQKVNTVIKDTKLSSYETIKTEQRKGQVYVLIAMSRAAFIKENQARLDEIGQQIQAQLTNVSSKNNLLQLVSYNKAIQLSVKAKDLIALLQVTNSKFKAKSYLDTYLSYQQKEISLTEKTQFSLKSTAEMKPLLIQIKKALQTRGFQVDTGNKSDSIIEIVGVIAKNEIFSTKNVSIKFEILVKTSRNQLVKSNSYNLNGSSGTNYSIARDGAFNQFTAKLKNKSDIYQLLGMK